MSERHKSSSKKRKHDRRAFSTSSSEDERPRSSSKKEKADEKSGSKGPSSESKMKLRIKSYLNANTDKVSLITLLFNNKCTPHGEICNKTNNVRNATCSH